MYSTSMSTVHCTVQSVLLFLGSVQFYLGGLAHCTVQSVSLFFARLNFIWGGLSPPSPNDAPPLVASYSTHDSRNFLIKSLDQES